MLRNGSSVVSPDNISGYNVGVDGSNPSGRTMHYTI